jgi:penicillin amidase
MVWVEALMRPRYPAVVAGASAADALDAVSRECDSPAMLRRRLFIAAAAAMVALLPPPPRPAAVAQDLPRLPGLRAPARVVVDRWGIPHVRAASLADAYYLWGYVTARDRLWQLAETRASAEGTLHRWLGNRALRADGGAQLFRLRERADAIWARDARDPALRVALERYAEGINARLAECRSGRAPWPPELVRLGAKPADWRPADCELTLLGLGVTLDLDLSDIADAALVKAIGAEAVVARRRFEERYVFDTIADDAPAAAPRSRHAGVPGPDAGVTLAASTVAAAARAAAAFPAHQPDGSDRASNEMVVGPARTALGRPLLANDPHLALGTPGAFHLVHLSVPDTLEAAGAAVPGLPALVSGRSTRCAWGVTALSADVVDAYADTLSADGRRVKGPRGWVDVVTRPFHLAFRVLGVPLPVPGQVRRYTPHGPVVVWDPKHRVAVAVRWSAMEDERVTLTGLVGFERSRNVDELAAHVRTLVTPTINAVAADVGGHTIYQAIGLVPRRTAEPVPGILPGDGRHEWPGFIAADSMPSWHPPADGYAVNGNNRPAHARSPYAWTGYRFAQDRAARMSQRLAGDRRITRQDLASVQNDTWSRASARQVPALLAAIRPLEGSLPPRSRAALDTLRAWDFDTRRWRVAPTLARSWWNAWTRRTRLEDLPGLALAHLSGEAPDTLTHGGAHESAAAAAAGALQTALDTLAARLGPDLGTWTWNRAHRARFTHLLADRDPAFEPPVVAEDGDGSTVAVAGTRAPWSFDVRFGPQFRHVVDLADTLTSWVVIPPWNAATDRGHSPDLRAAWARHDVVPLRMSWPAIERDAAERLDLAPGR